MERKRHIKNASLYRSKKNTSLVILIAIILIAIFLILFFITMGDCDGLLTDKVRHRRGSGKFGKTRLALYDSNAEKKPVNSATIFVSIAAFRDHECVTTLQSLFTRANNPHRVFIGLSEERLESDSSCINAPEVLENIGITRSRIFQWRDIVPSAFNTEILQNNSKPTPLLHEGRNSDNITCLLLPNAVENDMKSPSSILNGCKIITRVGNPDDARGPTYGRYLTSLFYNNQDYYMVIDSHSRFIPNWDIKMIERARMMPTRGVLSYYPNGYTPEDPDKEIANKQIMLMCKGVILNNNIPKLGAKWVSIRKVPILQGFVAAGYIFGDAQFVKDVPFDPYLPFLFDGEEILYTARLYTSGWDSYSPGDAFIFHNYNRKKAPRFFTIMRKERERTFAQRTSERRVLYLLQRKEIHTNRILVTEEEAHSYNPNIGKDEIYFGMGKLRPLEDYWHFVQLSDEFIQQKDNENRWMGGDELCKNI